MADLADRDFNLSGWGEEKRLIEGPCGHCHHAVAFKEPEGSSCLVFRQRLSFPDSEDPDEIREHYFVMGLCPRPRCQEATIVYRVESYFPDYRQDPSVDREEVIFPRSSQRQGLPEQVPEDLRSLYEEAGAIEDLSPNGTAFLARRMLEQCLRVQLKKPRGKLGKLIEAFLESNRVPQELHEIMEQVRGFGNIAGHPGQATSGDWVAVDRFEASYLLDVIAELFDFVYVRPKLRAEMQSRLDAKKKGEPLARKSDSIVIGGRTPPKGGPPISEPDDDLPF